MANILVVDDDNNFFAVLLTFLEQLGHKVSHAGNPDEFLIKSMNNPPDLVIMDMQFPGGGAPYATRIMQSNKNLSSVPMIFCSAMALEHMKIWFADMPHRRYHRKPVDISLLKRQIQELLPAPDLADPLASNSKQTPLAKAFEEELGRDSAKKEPNAVATRLADWMLIDAIRCGASDIHLDPFKNSVYIRYRIDGILRDQASYPKDFLPIIPRLRILADLPPAAAANPMPEEGSFEISSDLYPARARLCAYPSGYGDRIVIRLLNMGQGLLNLERLGFLPEDLKTLKNLIEKQNGIFLVCGITGSGKTTTLCSILQVLSQKNINVMTIEDPIEYQLTRVVHTQISPKIGLSFAEGLRAMLRQDPNVIMVGEIRDRETAEIALQAAMTGHMIFSTIHTANASGVVARLLGMGIEPYMISSFLVGVLAQRLVRKVCSQCAEPTSPNPTVAEALLKAVAPQYAQAVQTVLSGPGKKFMLGKGCSICHGSGYRGRVGIFELLGMNRDLRELVLKKPNIDEISQLAMKSGMRTLLMDAVAKAASGWTSLEEAMRVAV